MIKKIVIENFRCFNHTEISFKDLSIIVGKNNAGKSTLIEAFRILSVVINRASGSPYSAPPDWLQIDRDTLGIYPSIISLDISTRNIFHLYGDPPAVITAFFEDGARCVIYIGPDAEVFATLFDRLGANVASKRFVTLLGLKPFNILPQIGPLLRTENIVKIKTVQRNLDTPLSSRNFRNQLIYYDNDFYSFKQLAERTWRGLTVYRPGSDISGDGAITLFVRDNSFEAEIGWMGHGLQMWLQTMWFLARCEKDSTVILDEPDVYMHADLQRRLIRLINGRYRQVMIATHSVEIMAEVEADNILPIDHSKSLIGYASKAPVVQQIINNLGSIHNIEIARIFAHRKFLIVEGDKDDVKILGILQSKIFPHTFEPLDTLPKIFTEGWGGWQRVLGSFKVFKDNNVDFKTYCILDSDYHTESQKDGRREEALNNGFDLHIWNKKEIENFLLVPTAIFRFIERNKRVDIPLNLETIQAKLEEICASLKQEVTDDFATEIKDNNKSLAIKTVNQQARLIVEQAWRNDFRIVVPSKKVIARLSEWANKHYRVNIDSFALARELEIKEIDDEVKRVISAIEHQENFS